MKTLKWNGFAMIVGGIILTAFVAVSLQRLQPPAVKRKPTEGSSRGNQSAGGEKQIASLSPTNRYYEKPVSEMTRDELRRFQRRYTQLAHMAKAEGRKKMDDIDIRNGRNAEVRANEADLRKRAERLSAGMAQDEVFDIMDAPNKIGEGSMELWGSAQLFPAQIGEADAVGQPPKSGASLNDPLPSKAFQPLRYLSVDEITSWPIRSTQGLEIAFFYSPHPTGKLYHSTMDSFEYLEIWFDASSGKVLRWNWRTPMLTR